MKSLGKGPFVGVSWKSPIVTIDRMPNYTDIMEWKHIFSLKDVTFINLQSTNFENDLDKVKDTLGTKIYHFEELDQYDNLDDVSALCKSLDMCVSVSTAVAAIAAGVGTPTIVPTWKQSSWNNILLAPQGPNVKYYERNTWDSWDEVFAKIYIDVRNLTH